MRSAAGRYREVFGAAPLTCGAAGWQMNGAAFAEHDSAGYGYASDGRCRLNEDGTLCDPADGPHRLADAAGAPLAHIQLPTTLPTLDELLGRDIDGQLVSTANVADFLLRLTAGATRDHVYTLHAELEGQKLAPIFEQLLTGWRAQGYQLASMADYFQQVRAQPLPVCPITWGQVPGRSGQLIVQGGARPTPVHPQEKASG
jgi:peptidoglycan/xylan/chitin deacetylase (PgdA/CDA1 family)